MKLSLWERLRRARRLLRGTPYTVKPIHPLAHIPNPPSPPTAHTPPTKKPGHGLTGKQKHLHQLMHATLGNPFHWTYWEVRPSKLPTSRIPAAAWTTATALHAALVKLVTGAKFDCSFGAKALFWLAGFADDPTGENWTQWGNSVSTYDHLPKAPGLDNATNPKAADLAKCKVGWPVLFGRNGAWHMALVMEEGPDPLFWSDGGPGESTPNSYRLSQDPRRPLSVCIPKGLE